jgi:hypothetical protein
MNRKQLLIGLLIGGILAYVVSDLIVDKRLHDLQTALDTEIEIQSAELQNIASVLGSGGSVPDINAFIKECPSAEMTQYDTLLSALDKGLSKYQLTELYKLFNRCGDTAASRRAGTALLLEKQVDLYTQLVTQRAALGSYEESVNTLSKWNLLVEKEKNISALFYSLVVAQEEILVALMENVSPTSLLVENIRARAQTVREELSVATQEVSELRATLIQS